MYFVTLKSIGIFFILNATFIHASLSLRKYWLAKRSYLSNSWHHLLNIKITSLTSLPISEKSFRCLSSWHTHNGRHSFLNSILPIKDGIFFYQRHILTIARLKRRFILFILKKMSTYFWITIVCQLLFQVKTIYHGKKVASSDCNSITQVLYLEKNILLWYNAKCFMCTAHCFTQTIKEVMFKGQDIKK